MVLDRVWSSLSSPSLTRRYARLVAAITIALLLLSGILEMLFGYKESRQHIERLQTAQAEAASREIAQYLHAIEEGMRDSMKLPWGQEGFELGRKREELHRLMVLQPAIAELQAIDDRGREQLLVSREAVDRVGSMQPVEANTLPAFEPSGIALDRPSDESTATRKASWGPTYYRDGPEPWVKLAISSPVRSGGVLVGAVNLRFLADVVSGLRSPNGGEIYVVDSAGRLIAHPQAPNVLRGLDLSSFAPVVRARQESSLVAAIDATDFDGHPVIATAAAVSPTGWLVLVVQPRSLALAPAFATLLRTLTLVALAGLAAMAASLLLARRMAAPIVALRRATARIAAGDLASPISLPTSGDEIGQLARDFARMADELRTSYASLEAKVVDRTAALTDARDRLAERTVELASRRDEAERANAAKTRFLASASHDLRQPMHAIGLLVDVLRSRLTDPDQRSLAEKTHQAVRSMEALFGSLLDVSKLDSGAVQPQACHFLLQDLLDRLAASYAPLASAKSLELRVRKTGLTANTDPALLERMVGNLVTNAIRYTRRGGVLVGCRRRSGLVAVQVFDTGIGIPADQLDIAFEEFVRLDSAEPGDKGLGLGLSIVRRTAELLNLRVAVHSVPGRGSKFEILLPEAEQPIRSPIAIAPRTMPSLQGSFVLVVDDDEVNLEASAELLRQWGCLVATATSADGALSELDQHLRPPDLVMTDLRLGKGDDGLALIRRVRSKLDLPVPALLVTADVHVPQTEGTVALLRKPAGADRLLLILLHTLSQTTSSVRTAPPPGN